MDAVGAMAPQSFRRMHLAPMKSRILCTLAPATSLIVNQGRQSRDYTVPIHTQVTLVLFVTIVSHILL